MFYTQTPKGLLTTTKWLWIYKASQDLNQTEFIQQVHLN